MQLVASKEEAEVAQAIAKSVKSHRALQQTMAPARPRGTSFRGRRRTSRPNRTYQKCWVCGQSGHHALACSQRRTGQYFINYILASVVTMLTLCDLYWVMFMHS